MKSKSNCSILINNFFRLIYNIPREILYNNFENSRHIFVIQYDSPELANYKFEIY